MIHVHICIFGIDNGHPAFMTQQTDANKSQKFNTLRTDIFLFSIFKTQLPGEGFFEYQNRNVSERDSMWNLFVTR